MGSVSYSIINIIHPSRNVFVSQFMFSCLYAGLKISIYKDFLIVNDLLIERIT